jgi:class II lanthipeptide synthase
LQRWRSQSPFRTGCYFAQRLAIDGTSEDEFLYLLGEPIAAVHRRFPAPPAWLAELAEAFARPAASSLPLPEPWRGQEVIAFLDVIEPLISQGCDRLQQGVQALAQTRSDLPFDPGTVEEIMFANLPGQLLRMLSRTMALELHMTRLQGLLEGDTSEERFRSFLQRVCQRDTALTLLREYPVLTRQLMMRIDQWVRFSLEFLQHLCADWGVIRTTFTPKSDPGILVQVHQGMSASHPGARSVLIARFNLGVQVVYKPWPMAVDVHFQELLTWLNDRGNHPPFRTLTILDRGTYGWVEFVAAQSCGSAAGVRRFYERQGGYLALLYALEAIDFRFENLIAAGEHPVLIDLDTLFHAREKGTDLHHPDLPASKMMAYSVMRVGLLPQRLWSNAASEGIDISGLGGEAGQLTPEGVPCWERMGTDEMRLVRKRVVLPGGQHRPTLNGTEVAVLHYTEAIAAGFTAVYQLLLEHREELLADHGPLARFADDTVRVIVRPGRTYDLLLQDSYHPDLLRDALDHGRFFDRLWVEVEHCPHLARVILAEREDLQQGDMPIFRTRPGSRDLWSSTNERIPNFFDEPSMAVVQRRVQHLSDEDLSQQLWFIRASLATLAREPDQACWPVYCLTEPQTIATRERLLAAARAAGDRLEALALRSADEVAWIGLTHINGRYWSITPLGMDLYDGLPGVTLFLAYLGTITREEHYAALAQDALTTLQRQVECCQSFITSIGGFRGWGGLIYTLAHLGTLWNEPALLAEAEAIVEHLPALIERDELLDTGVWRILCMVPIEHKRISAYAMVANLTRTPERISPCSNSLYSIPPSS